MSTLLKKTLYVISFFVLIGLVFVIFDSTGDKSESFQSFSSSEFLAEQDGLNLLIVGEEINHQDFRESLKTEIQSQGQYLQDEFTITQYEYDEQFQSTYSHLEITKSPAYLLFDSANLIYKTYNYEQLVKYLVNYSKENSESDLKGRLYEDGKSIYVVNNPYLFFWEFSFRG